MFTCSPREVSAYRGPSEVRRMPLALAILDLERSNRSTPNQDRSAQLSGPEIPGVQISEEGNLLLITIKPSTNFPLELDN